LFFYKNNNNIEI